MDEASQKVFDEIVGKEPEALTEAEADILRARRSYLAKDQEEKFADVLESTSNPYESMSAADLKALVAERKIEAAGTKRAELIAALLEADAAAQ